MRLPGLMALGLAGLLGGQAEVSFAEPAAVSCRVEPVGQNLQISDAQGQALWSVNPHAVSAYLSNANYLNGFLPVQLAPNCEWLVLTGGAAYPHVWLINRNGKKAEIHTDAEPERMVISPQSDRVFMTTPSGEFYLADANGGVLKQDKAAAYTQVEYLEDGGLIIAAFNGGATLLTKQGAVVWRNGPADNQHFPGASSLKASADGKWFMIDTEIWQGSAAWEKTLVSRFGKEIWREQYRLVAGEQCDASVPLAAAAPADSLYIEHFINRELSHRFGWRCEADKPAVPIAPGDGLIDLMAKAMQATGFNQEQIESLTAEASNVCARILYHAVKIPSPPPQLALFKDNPPVAVDKPAQTPAKQAAVKSPETASVNSKVQGRRGHRRH